MDRALPSSGEIWIHFKEKQYRIITLAEDAKTGESYVVYLRRSMAHMAIICVLWQCL